MKVILQKDVKNVGKAGEIVEVSEGYGRNFLLPKKLAVPATAANVNEAKQKAGSAARKKAQEADEAKLMAAQLAKVEVTIPVRVGDGGKLFGSVTGKDVAEALMRDHGIITTGTQEEINQAEMDYLFECYRIAVEQGYPFWRRKYIKKTGRKERSW